MRIGWGFGIGPIRVGGTLWRSKKRKKQRKKPETFKGAIPQIRWKCPHNHSRRDLAEACAEREARRRGLDIVE